MCSVICALDRVRVGSALGDRARLADSLAGLQPDLGRLTKPAVLLTDSHSRWQHSLREATRMVASLQRCMAPLLGKLPRHGMAVPTP